MRSKNLQSESINTGSMADIAFLLLIFFLVSTTILQEKGLILRLPPEVKNPTSVEVKDRNVYNIRINSRNQYLIEKDLRQNLVGLREELQTFVLNDTGSAEWAESPEKAVVSIKADRGTDYKTFIAVLDEVKAAYYEIYGKRVGVTGAEFRLLDLSDPEQRALYDKGRAGIPMNISIAEPDAANS
ncbi:ExbD/TolR family protein [Reichenbachiella ulvae]|uniref:Biopolymer transporter ExbD n=1 Tax=Reichenbachiella ulvae TaxID=2980104 RepID=A0ABT3CPB7_9BACT|nr:biopolymer transporter ExbD [Reichenbachiella ulvae]MCV9385497.1 biopolymer transporter ExbD [Reichenbachiella ulvae]